MKTYDKKRLIVIAYTLILVLSIIIWFICPSETMIHFFNACSMIYCFLIAMALGRCLVSYLALGWAASFLPVVFICSIIAVKKKNYIPFSAVIALELMISLVMIAIKIYLKNYNSLSVALVGLVFRSILCYGIIRALNSNTIE